MSTEPNTRIHPARVELAAVPTAPGLARSFVRHTLRLWALDDLIDSAELITSELVTNAAKASRTPAASPAQLPGPASVIVELQVDDGSLRIAVKDTSRCLPVLQTSTDDAEGGRGLFLVAALSTRWDVFLVRDGKVTWAELPLAQDDAAVAEKL